MVTNWDNVYREQEEARADGYSKGVEDANQMVGALWSDLFNKDLVKAEGAEFFDKWRARIKALTLETGVQ
jgi:hypothetical protein